MRLKNCTVPSSAAHQRFSHTRLGGDYAIRAICALGTQQVAIAVHVALVAYLLSGLSWVDHLAHMNTSNTNNRTPEPTRGHPTLNLRQKIDDYDKQASQILCGVLTTMKSKRP
jgi:hypothetical protein